MEFYGPHSDKTRIKMSKSHKGKTHTEETKDKIKKSHMGIIPWNKGLTKEIDKRMEKMSKTIRKNPTKYWAGKILSEEHRAKIIKTLINGEQCIGKNNPSWKGGISFEPYSSEFNKELKELIRFRDGYKCQKCGCPEIENNQKLVVHHIDYDKKNCLPLNLISLCIGCNVKVNFNRKKWTKYFKKKFKRVINSNTIQLNLRFNNSIKRK